MPAGSNERGVFCYPRAAARQNPKTLEAVARLTYHNALETVVPKGSGGIETGLGLGGINAAVTTGEKFLRLFFSMNKKRVFSGPNNT